MQNTSSDVMPLSILYGDELMQKPYISVHAVIVHPIPPEYRWKWGKREFVNQFEVSYLNRISIKNDERGQKILGIAHGHSLDVMDMTF